MSENFETRANGFKVYTINLETGEELKFPIMNTADMESISAGFSRDFMQLRKGLDSARTDQDRAQLGSDLHWLQLEAGLTNHEIEDWRNLSQLKFYTGLKLGSETAGMTEKK